MKTSTTLQIFDFNSHSLRVITDSNGESWFIAKDVSDVLEYSDASKMISRLDDDEFQNRQIRGSGFNNKGTLIINESGLYSSILGSNKPEAKAFKKHVTSEILPLIRKTGGYSAPQKQDSQTIVKEFKSMLALSKAFGLKGNQALLSANKAVKKTTGVDCQAMLGIELEAPVQSRLVTPTDMGLLINLSGIKVNQLLKEKGYQTDRRDSKGKIIWTPTDNGMKFATLLDTGKKMVMARLFNKSNGASQLLKN